MITKLTLKPLRWPNCNKKVYQAPDTVYNDDIYNKYTCEGCVHIIVLDYLKSTRE